MDSFVQKNGHWIDAVSNQLNKEDKVSIVTPRRELIMSAFSYVSFDGMELFTNSLKVCFVLQDVYYQPGAACGIAMATPNTPMQKSLEVVFNKLIEKSPTPIEMPELGDIRGWASQGVLLTNASLTTQTGVANAHKNIWKDFTASLLEWISDTHSYVVFVLFGESAKSMRKYIDAKKHSIFETSHPVSRQEGNAFSKCDIFNDVNLALINNKREPIDWSDYDWK